MFAIIFNSIFYNVEARSKKIFDETATEGLLISILSENPDLLLQQYSNVLSVETMALSNADCSHGEIVKAYEQKQDGTVCLLEVEATLTKILYQEESDLSLEGDEMFSTLYVLTGNTSSKDSMTKNGVTLNGTIVWKDHLGVNNELVSISGTRAGSYAGEGTYYCWSGSHAILGWVSFSGTSFNDSSVSGEKGFWFGLEINSPSSNSTSSATLIMKTSIFD